MGWTSISGASLRRIAGIDNVAKPLYGESTGCAASVFVGYTENH
jgi:hypothetical protein